ncbi:ketosteroid isomerase-like protein [Sphingopyxis sp. OAS728]|uniref:nuclear transport factor 2 family protein n=1 Tax=Sphingopyxis sp. OAS728 TaxID=2663823 RepID=UPI0017898389|nr:nuclear transport factor 2 family protein [Sphingopyxis sp. OAS728]MBE1526880.1 ketosteroid isomerase-like protein [Sphingopyxis sp. OAS728]
MQDERIAEAEAALRMAMLASDVATLDALLDDELCFTDQSGNRLSKANDLAAHKSGLLELETIDIVGSPDIHRWGDCATVCVTVDLAGFYDGESFFGRFAYSRVWHERHGRWRLVLAHCSPLPATR